MRPEVGRNAWNFRFQEHSRTLPSIQEYFNVFKLSIQEPWLRPNAHLFVRDELDLVARHLDAFLRADDENDVRVVVETRDRDLGRGRQLEVGQLLALHPKDEAVVFLRYLDATTRLHNRRDGRDV